MVDKNEEEPINEIVSNEDGEKDSKKSSTGLEENVAGFLCYLATFVTGIIFLFIEKKSKFIRFHAMQSTVFFIGIWVVGYVIDYVPFIGWLLSTLVSLLGFILWIVLMIKAYQKEYYKLPIIGDLSEDLLEKIKPKANA